MADRDLTERARAVLARVVKNGGAYVYGRDVASARSLVRRELITMEDNGQTRTGTECDRERWWCKPIAQQVIALRWVERADWLDGMIAIDPDGARWLTLRVAGSQVLEACMLHDEHAVECDRRVRAAVDEVLSGRRECARLLTEGSGDR